MIDEAHAEIADLRNRLGEVESQNQALQERAEKAEASLSEIYELRRVWDAPTNLFWKAVGIAHAALSPTQETDPE